MHSQHPSDIHLIKTGANPGFPVRGGANTPTYDFAKISKNLHEIEKILVRRGQTPRSVNSRRLVIETKYLCS